MQGWICMTACFSFGFYLVWSVIIRDYFKKKRTSMSLAFV